MDAVKEVALSEMVFWAYQYCFHLITSHRGFTA